MVDPSGLVVVRGRTVRLGRFAGAGADLNVGLADLVTAGRLSDERRDSAP